MPDRSESLERWRRVLTVSWALVGVLILAAASVFALVRISPALVPFGLALVIVFLLRTPVAALERRRLKRGAAVAVCYLAILAALAVLGLFIVPPLVDQVRQFLGAFPGYYDRVLDLWGQVQRQYSAVAWPSWLDDALVGIRDGLAEQLASWSANLAKTLFSVGGGAVSFLLNVFLALVVAFWLLKDMEVIKREFVALAGPKRRDEASIVIGKVSTVLSGYLRGQAIVSATTAVIVTIGFTVLGVPYALVLGLLAGALNIVPWFGPLVAEVISAIAAAFVSPWLALWAVLVVIGAQQITDMFITPRVMSEQVDLHPVLVIFSLLTGAALAGIVGMVLAIPVAAIAKGLFVYYFEKWTDSSLATENGALFRSAVPCETDDRSAMTDEER
ncbi:AI-2E family transporter [Coriobacteriia bacterium Es71-Z0120]|uniref:AI-2E family transporter n=1 Tax=Parvivirga hydrogeniphila TaxID=2939460 RepID=UPI002260E005|nr:AI-2E family transporter [Parvivirga hydrogeniphila]MCL4079171.1 AI-2E family transporter [Parvivirga hydrogeniphila]